MILLRHPPFLPSSLRLLAGLLALLVACAEPAPDPRDGAVDVAAPDDAPSPMDDAPPRDDARADRGPPTPEDTGVVEAPCALDPLIDLDALGTRAGDTTSYTGSNRAAPAASPVVGACGGRPGHVVAFRYTVRARARLIVSTFHPETAAHFDTVAWAQTTCRSMDPGIGCNDDVAEPYERRGQPVGGRFHSLFTTTAPRGGNDDHTLDAGTVVYLFVGSYTPHTGATPTGTFRLTVTEAAAPGAGGTACDPSTNAPDGVPGASCREGAVCAVDGADHSGFRCVDPIPVGGLCDPRGTGPCVPGARCRSESGGWRCAVEGVAGGPCRWTTPQCDAGLACNRNSACAPVALLGARCDSNAATNVCASGTTCALAAGEYRCAAHGTSGASCRAMEPRCDVGFACEQYASVCVPEVPVGGRCDRGGAGSVCVGGTCIPEGATARCVANGAPGTRCRASAPACDAGATCGPGGDCIPEIPLGGACDGSGSRRPANACVAGTSCRTTLGMSRCVVQGTAGNPCRATAPSCDPGLACGASGCVPWVAVGERCDPGWVSNRCVEGTSCTTEAGVSRCARDGTQGNRCRSTAPSCDAGLGCSGYFCRTALALGAACDLTGATDVCPPASSCRAVTGGARCVADRALHGRCEPVSPCNVGTVCGNCDAGLICGDARTCVPELAVGAACDPARTQDVCTPGASCVTAAGASRCQVDGARDGRCRAGEPRCDAGLACGGGSLCVTGLPVGAKCDPAGATGLCAARSSCLRARDAWLCVADGARGGRCRSTGSRCDAGLACNINSVCLAGLPIGSACDPRYVATVCREGASCAATMGGGRCVADGILGGRCRNAIEARCDAGLACDNRSHCVVGVPVGGSCDPMRQASVCVEGAACGVVMGAARCIPDGALGGVCRWPGPRCDAGLSCGRERCVPEVPVGAACDPDAVLNACASNARCQASGGAPRCVALGALGGGCRLTAPACDATLACGGGSLCRPAVAVGERCDPAGVADACAPGGSCQPVMGASRCVADGARDARCRASAPLCDAGLSCAPAGASDPGLRFCVAGLGLGAACDPSRPATSRCVDGAVCRGRATAGTCVAAGYTRAASAATFVDACAAPGATTLLTAGGDPAANTALPFAFTFFGDTQPAGTAVHVSTLGWLRFGATAATTGWADTLPTLRPDNAIFALWTYLDFSATTPMPGRLCAATVGAAPARAFVLEWQNLSRGYRTGNTVTMEVQLHEGGGAIDVLYDPPPRLTTDDGAVTVGLQGPGGTSFVQVCGGAHYAPTACAGSTLANTRYTPTP